jgi:hypothetical protein
MGNIHRGDIEFTVDKKVYTLRYSINAMCDLEERLGQSVVEVGTLMSDPAKLSMSVIRSIFWAGLRDHHEAITETEAGRIMSALGIVEASQMIAKAFASAFPEVQTPGPLSRAALGKSTGKEH